MWGILYLKCEYPARLAKVVLWILWLHICKMIAGHVEKLFLSIRRSVLTYISDIRCAKWTDWSVWSVVYLIHWSGQYLISYMGLFFLVSLLTYMVVRWLAVTFVLSAVYFVFRWVSLTRNQIIRRKWGALSNLHSFMFTYLDSVQIGTCLPNQFVQQQQQKVHAYIMSVKSMHVCQKLYWVCVYKTCVQNLCLQNFCGCNLVGA